MKIADSLKDIQEGLGVGLLPPLYGDQLEVLVEGNGGGGRVAAHKAHHVLGLDKSYLIIKLKYSEAPLQTQGCPASSSMFAFMSVAPRRPFQELRNYVKQRLLADTNSSLKT